MHKSWRTSIVLAAIAGLLIGYTVSVKLVGSNLLSENFVGTTIGAIVGIGVMGILVNAWTALEYANSKRKDRSPLRFDGERLDTGWNRIQGGRVEESLYFGNVAGVEIDTSYQPHRAIFVEAPDRVTGYRRPLYQIPLDRLRNSDRDVVATFISIVGSDAPALTEALHGTETQPLRQKA